MARRKQKREEVLAFTEHAFSLAKTLGIQTALVLADEPGSGEVLDSRRTTERVVWLVGDLTETVPKRPEDLVLAVPGAKLSGVSQIRIGLYSATLRGYLDLSERVVCLSGVAGSGRLDMVLVTQPKRDFPWLRQEDLDRTKDIVHPREFGRLLDLSLRFAAEGREGKPIGAVFVLGDDEQLEPYLRQLILNPCKGHARRLRSIHNPEFAESLREFCALDGAIVVSRSGVVESVGTYIDAPTASTRLRHGLGARHAAAAALTKATDAVAFAISESSGTVILFDDGKPVLELERPS
jgi:DNA integrity scanning protein DisA with diadenylate cyclase activity